MDYYDIPDNEEIDTTVPDSTRNRILAIASRSVRPELVREVLWHEGVPVLPSVATIRYVMEQE